MNPANLSDKILHLIADSEKYNELLLSAPIIAYRSTTLPQPFHKDPGDQIIVATAREENAILLTKDAKIQEYSYVKTLW